MTLKICHLISGDLWAGAEAVAFQLLRGLQSREDVKLFVILLNPGALREKLELEGIEVVLLDEKERSFLNILWAATKVVRAKRPDILHSHRYKEHFLAYLLSLSLESVTKLVATQHGMPEFYDSDPSIRQRLKSRLNFALLAKKFHKIAVVSSDIENAFLNRGGFKKERLETIRNGIVIPRVKNFNDRKEVFVVGSAGRFFPVKDYPLMVEVAREVHAKSDRISFELAGEGPAIGKIRATIAAHGLQSHFVLKGFVADVEKFYDGLDVYINTSKHEGIPMSVLEAMAHGVPPIAPRVGGLGEIITDGVDGYLVDGRDPRLFAEKCLVLCLDVELRKNMAHAARRTAMERFSVDRMVTEYFEFYLCVSHGIRRVGADNERPQLRNHTVVESKKRV